MPQKIEHVYLHGGEIWVKVVFADFLNLGTGISDTDGDGQKEIYAKVADTHYDAELHDKLDAARNKEMLR